MNTLRGIEKLESLYYQKGELKNTTVAVDVDLNDPPFFKNYNLAKENDLANSETLEERLKSHKIESNLPDIKRLLRDGCKLILNTHIGSKGNYSNDICLPYLRDELGSLDFLEKDQIQNVENYRNLKDALENENNRLIVAPNPRRHFSKEKELRGQESPTLKQIYNTLEEDETGKYILNNFLKGGELEIEINLRNGIEKSHRRNDIINNWLFSLISNRVLLGSKYQNQLKIIEETRENMSRAVVGGGKIGKIKDWTKFLKEKEDFELYLTGVPGAILYQGEKNGDGELKKYPEVYSDLKPYIKERVYIPKDLKKKDGEVIDIGKETLEFYTEKLKERNGDGVTVFAGPAGDTDRGKTESTCRLIRAAIDSQEVVVCGGNTNAVLDNHPNPSPNAKSLATHPKIQKLTGGGSSTNLLTDEPNMLDFYLEHLDVIKNEEKRPVEEVKKEEPLIPVS